ncbi:MAG TPA: YggT family protein [Candidatus Limnocylindrales bacterium]
MALFARSFLELLVLALTALIFGRVIVSWVDPVGRNQLSSFVIQATEPILAPVRRLLPSMGMVDLSPMIVIFVLMFVLRAVGA